MVRRLNVWFTAGHASVTVVNGAERQTSADSMPAVLDAMPPADRETLRRFCLAVLHYTDTHDLGTFTATTDATGPLTPAEMDAYRAYWSDESRAAREAAQCDSCGDHRADVTPRGNGSSECLPCWRSSLEHGHRHGLHTDMDRAEAEYDNVPDCPLCRGPITDWTEAGLVARMQAEVTADITAGRIPRTVRTFAELHDYTDANEYGGLTRPECPLKPADSDAADLINRAQVTVDRWLQVGRP